MRLTLHVGTKKTATSTLQHMLGRLKPELVAAGVLFPATTDLHQRLARSLIASSAGNGRMGRVMQATLDHLAEEIEAAGLPDVLVSSEHLISAPPEAVSELRNALHRRLPGLREVVVLCYLREPVSFATSMLQQDLKNGKTRLEEALADPWPYRLADWVATWADAFGREGVRLRQFHPGHLSRGNILGDVLEVIGLPDLPVPHALPRMNPSLSQAGVLVADALNAHYPEALRDKARRGRYKRLLHRIPGSRFVLPPEIQELVIQRSGDDLAALKARWGLEIRPERIAAPVWPGLSDAEARAMAEKLVATVEG